jgi:manganese/iron transport system substrate-binding protein
LTVLSQNTAGMPCAFTPSITLRTCCGVPAVFCESTVNTAPAKQVARETGARYGGVLYVDSLSRADGPVPTYLDLLRVTAQTVADGLAAPN